jgi:Xaa-Pro aminopeptidase
LSSARLVETSDTPASIAIDIIQCPIEDAKAIKNENEIQGMRNAYLRDGRATVSVTLSLFSYLPRLISQVRFLSFMNDKLLKEKRPVGEWAAGQMLTRYRRQEDNFK